MEDIQVAGVKQQTLSSKQSLPSDLEGTGCRGISRVGRTRIFLQVDKDFVLDDRAARRGTKGLVSGALSGILITRISPEAVTIKLNSLPWLLSKIVDHYGFDRHLDDVTGVGPIKFAPSSFGKSLSIHMDRDS